MFSDSPLISEFCGAFLWNTFVWLSYFAAIGSYLFYNLMSFVFYCLLNTEQFFQLLVFEVVVGLLLNLYLVGLYLSNSSFPILYGGFTAFLVLLSVSSVSIYLYKILVFDPEKFALREKERLEQKVKDRELQIQKKLYRLWQQRSEVWKKNPV